MTSAEIAWILKQISDYMELLNENSLKKNDYRNTAKLLMQYKGSVHNFIKEFSSKKRHTFHIDIMKDIQEIMKTKKSKRLLLLKEKIPKGVQELLDIPGIETKVIRLLYNKLKVKNLQSLEKAAREKKIRQLPGMGSKTELSLLRGIELLTNPPKTFPLGVATYIANEFLQILNNLPKVKNSSIAGDVRRAQEMVDKIVLVVECGDKRIPARVVGKHPLVKDILQSDQQKIVLLTKINLPIEIHFCSDNFFSCLHHYTGSEKYLAALSKELDGSKSDLSNLNSEEELYIRTDLQFITPELRETDEVIKLSKEHCIPELIEFEDIKGDLHMHTNWSDGVNTVEEMVEAAQKKGYEYIAITDHSRTLTIAGGLSIEEIHKQHQMISEINEKILDFSVFTGIEVDILKAGDLDYPDEILENTDLIIASVHNNLRQDEETITERIESAVKNPNVDILALPTGRILGRRNSTLVNLERIFSLAEKTGTALEINSSPDRLDLNSENVKIAQEYEIPIAINTDAHSIKALDDIEFGISTGKRGMLEKQTVINTWPKEDMKRWLKRKK